MERLFWICVGGAAGTAARYGIALWAAARFGTAFPTGTLIVNLTGCFVISVIMSVALDHAWPETLRFALTVGFLGGFTTYSSFNYETMALASRGATNMASLYAAITIAGGLAAGSLGVLCGRAIAGR